MEQNIISKSVVRAMNRYLKTGDVKENELEAFKHDMKMAKEIINKFAEYYHVM